jgi:hypothetical protein
MSIHVILLYLETYVKEKKIIFCMRLYSTDIQLILHVNLLLLLNFSSSSSALSVKEEVICEEDDVFSQGDISLSQDGL